MAALVAGAMSDASFCGGCGTEVAPECRNALRRLGCIKVHWECWSDCNLACPFCYRSRGTPLTTAQGALLLRVVRTAGVASVVFAGGDPSIRADLDKMVAVARQHSMRIEIQTNAHHVRPRFLELLQTVDMVGLSLDGEDAETHDQMRRKPGNYRRVLNLLATLDEAGVPLIVRTVITKENYRQITGLCEVLSGIRNLTRWSLMEFSPTGGGTIHSAEYSLDRFLFDETVRIVKAKFPRREIVESYSLDDKVGVYCLVSPDGRVFGTGTTTVAGVYPIAGHVLSDHIADWVARLPFDADHHVRRYGADAQRSVYSTSALEAGSESSKALIES
jgi:MoaA/NifB/PqqE/SkfB family radical SAM enzyme